MAEWILTSSILILVVIVLRTVCKGKISLRLQYAIWGLVLVRLLLPFSFGSSSFSVVNLAEAAKEQPAVQAVMDVGNLNIPSQSYEDAYQEVLEQYEAQGIDVAHLQGSNLEALEYEAYALMKGRDLSEILSGAAGFVWLAGIILVGAVFLYTNLRFRKKVMDSRFDLDIRKDGLAVYATGEIDTPCLFGLKHPAIYVTHEVADSATLLRHTIEHEATHYRHGDHIWSILRCVCLALHWYNPLVWWAAFLSQRDAELACDEATIRRLGEAERAEYGRTLIGLTCRKRANVLVTATTMTASRSSIKERILLIAKKPKMAVYTLIAVLLVAAIAVGCTFTGAKEDKSAAYAQLDTYLTDYSYEQVKERMEPEDVHYIGSEGDYSLVYCSGMGPTLILYRFEADGDQITVTDHTNGSYAISGGLSVNHLVDGDKHIYFGTISDYHWMPEDDSRLPLDWKSLVFYDEDGTQHFADVASSVGYLCVLDSPISDFWVVEQGGNVPLKMEQYLQQGYFIKDVTWHSEMSDPEPVTTVPEETDPLEATIGLPGLGTLYESADYEKVCIAVLPTGSISGEDFKYIIPEDQALLLEYYQSAVACVNQDLKWDNDLLSTGWRIVYQGQWWQIMTDGTMSGSKGIIAGEDAKELYAFCAGAVREVGIGEPVRPEDITGIKSATLYWDGVHTITDEYALSKIENWFSNARDYGSVQCWFGAQLVLELENGETLTLSIATDSCAVWMSEGLVYGFGEVTEDGIAGNEEFYSLFTSPATPEKASEKDWNMQAVVVDADGRVMEQTDLAVRLTVSDQEDGSKAYNLRFDYPEEIYNSVAGIISAPSDDSPVINWCFGWGHRKGDSLGLVQTPFYLGLDLEKESFLIDFDDDADVYLIAYRPENTDFDEIWEYFRTLIDTVPEQFPDISGNP